MGRLPVSIVRRLFLTWILWDALRNPQSQHPIFRHAHRQRPVSEADRRFWRRVWAGIGISIVILSIVAPVPTLPALLTSGLLIPRGLLLFSGTVLGCIWITRISTSLAHTKISGKYDLLRLTPADDFDSNWLLSTGIVHHRGWLNTVYRIVRGLALTLGVLLSLVIFMGALTYVSQIMSDGTQDTSYYWDAFFTVLLPLIFVTGLWLDHLQSILVALLIGMLLPERITSTNFVRWLAPLVYLLVQTLTYIGLVVGFWLMSAILTNYLGTTVTRNGALALLTLFLLFSLRDALISILWRLLARCYPHEAIHPTTKQAQRLNTVPE
ncbi:MAG: hypothetical protein AAFN11_06295 [Chloroflexota bacterium]